MMFIILVYWYKIHRFILPVCELLALGFNIRYKLYEVNCKHWIFINIRCMRSTVVGGHILWWVKRLE